MVKVSYVMQPKCMAFKEKVEFINTKNSQRWNSGHVMSLDKDN